jgi:cytoskeletal protein CcmA (bactofilin family)
MWAKKATEHSKRAGSALSILSDDLTIEGDIVSEGEVHINGIVKGDVTARKVALGKDGAITGTVDADDAIIGGKLAGRLSATTAVLLGTARVSADITHVSLSIAPEAVFEGFSRRVDMIGAADKPRAADPPRLAPPVLQSI